jgi:hypothetical protein
MRLGETVMIATVDAMMTAVRMVARGVVILIIPRCLMWTLHAKSATSTGILQRTVGGAMEMMMILTVIVVTKATRVQTLNPME